MVFQAFSKNFSDILMEPLFQYLLSYCYLFFPLFSVKIDRITINVIGRKINNTVIIVLPLPSP